MVGRLLMRRLDETAGKRKGPDACRTVDEADVTGDHWLQAMDQE